MEYVEGRIVHDADSHTMETAEMLADFATMLVKNHLLGFDAAASVATSVNDIEQTLAHRRDPLLRSRRPARASRDHARDPQDHVGLVANRASR
jgi:hypothetical protein